MSVEDPLPEELIAGATLRGNEYGWRVESFPNALRVAERLGFACLGGQFQFRLPDSVCEMYWLAADSKERLPNEDWNSYRLRSIAEVSEKFQRLVAETDFEAKAHEWPTVKDRILAVPDIHEVLTFVAYFVTERELSKLSAV